MKIITAMDVEALAIGAGILGSGGGGNPYYDSLVARRMLEKKGTVKLISVDKLSDNDVVLPVCFMGAPLVSVERLQTGREFAAIVHLYERVSGKKVTALMSGEIGGANAFTGVTAAAELGLPLVDADLLGRAFPELQMSFPTLFNFNASPAVMCDGNGTVIMLQTPDNKKMEECARSAVVALGSSAALGFFGMTGKQVQSMAIHNTVSYALQLGKAVIAARKNNTDSVQAVVKAGAGFICASGVITDIQQEIKNGFLVGTFTVTSPSSSVVIDYQNENLVVKKDGHPVVTTPDIIIPIDVQTATPLTSDSLRYGLRIAVLVLPAPEAWKSQEGLALVGPRAFGYEFDYKRNE